MVKRKLYKLTIQTLGDFYVLATDPTSAIEALDKVLDSLVRGNPNDRKVTHTELITEEAIIYADGKLKMYDEDRFIDAQNILPKSKTLVSGGKYIAKSKA